MKSPVRTPYIFPSRLAQSILPYAVDWSALLEPGETVVSTTIVVRTGDTIVGQVSTSGNVTTFWLSGGSQQPPVQLIYIGCTTSLGETDGFLAMITVG